jgi:hypothetical protein
LISKEEAMGTRILSRYFSMLMSFIFLSLAFALVCDSEIEHGAIVGVWLFDEGAGSVAKDASGNGHDGEISDAKWVPGKFGKALEFEGSGDSIVKVDHFDELNLENFTLAAWINVQGTVGYQGIVAKDGVNLSQRTYGMFVVDGQPKIHYSFTTQGGNHNTINGSAIAAADGEWHHVAMTYDGTTVRGYVDGVLDIETQWIGPSFRNDQPLSMGSDSAGRFPLKGVVDEVYVFSVALSEWDIAELMGIQIDLAVDASGKLTATWGWVRESR